MQVLPREVLQTFYWFWFLYKLSWQLKCSERNNHSNQSSIHQSAPLITLLAPPTSVSAPPTLPLPHPLQCQPHPSLTGWSSATSSANLTLNTMHSSLSGNLFTSLIWDGKMRLQLEKPVVNDQLTERPTDWLTKNLPQLQTALHRSALTACRGTKTVASSVRQQENKEGQVNNNSGFLAPATHTTPFVVQQTDRQTDRHLPPPCLEGTWAAAEEAVQWVFHRPRTTQASAHQHVSCAVCRAG